MKDGYDILESDTQVVLDQMVNDAMREGKIPIGGLVVRTELHPHRITETQIVQSQRHIYMQSMVEPKAFMPALFITRDAVRAMEREEWRKKQSAFVNTCPPPSAANVVPVKFPRRKVGKKKK